MLSIGYAVAAVWVYADVDREVLHGAIEHRAKIYYFPFWDLFGKKTKRIGIPPNFYLLLPCHHPKLLLGISSYGSVCVFVS